MTLVEVLVQYILNITFPVITTIKNYDTLQLRYGKEGMDVSRERWRLAILNCQLEVG